MLNPLPSHTKEFKHDITAAALSLGIEQTEMVGLVLRDWMECYGMCLARDILVRQHCKGEY